MERELEITVNIMILENDLYKCTNLLQKAVIAGKIGKLRRELHSLQHPFKKKEEKKDGKRNEV